MIAHTHCAIIEYFLKRNKSCELGGKKARRRENDVL